jgi:hypothetical protein
MHYVVKAADAQLVPVYAYDQRFSKILYIRDNENDRGGDYMLGFQSNSRPNGVYQFIRMSGPSFPLDEFRQAKGL